MKKDKLIISAYGSHNAAVVMHYKGKTTVVEVERWLDSKNIGLTNYMPVRHSQLVFDQIVDWLMAQTDKSDIDLLITGYFNLKPKYPVKQTYGCEHHMAHAACTFYQSSFKEALIFSFDGGGDSSYFNVYTGDRDKGITLVDKFNYDLGFPYMILSDYLVDIKKESLSIGNLVYAGKLMGLCSYGNVHEEWLPFFDAFYEKFNYFGNSYIGGAEARYEAVTLLMNQIGITDFDFEETRIEGQLSWDIAATTQRAFERQFFRYARPYLDKYPDMPVCLSGGCALNVLLNTILLEERNGKVFIPPNTNDCGIAVGGLLDYLKPQLPFDITYAGLPLMDENEIGMYLEDRKYSVIENVQLEELAPYISRGNIVGFIQGYSEHGSRALGNRSILCNPSIKDMKDILNEKVKHREWYRPFAPLVKLDQVQKYFDFKGDDGRHMTFVAKVREDWKDRLPSITHNDGTGRLQTVTATQNPAIYELLTHFEKISGHGVLLNTSFNDNGKPILSRFSAALKILTETKLDAVYYYDRRLLITKQGDERKFTKSLENTDVAPLKNESSVVLFAFAKDVDDLKNNYFPMIDSIVKKLDEVILVYPTIHQEHFSKYVDGGKIRLYPISDAKHYCRELIHKKYKMAPALAELNKNDPYLFSRFIKPYWAKEVVRDNVFGTKYFMFIDLSYFLENKYNYDIVRDVKLLKDNFTTDEKVIITSIKEFNTFFEMDFLKSRFRLEKDPEEFPTPAIFGGDVESVDWFSTNYEGMINWFMGTDKIGESENYVLISYIENSHRYKFIEMEKVKNET